jgi:hypothetical protein
VTKGTFGSKRKLNLEDVMKRAILCFSFAALSFASVFAQLPPTPMGIGTLGPGGFLGAAAQGVTPEGPLTGPSWFTAGSLAFTPDTALEYPSSVYDPAKKVMMTFGGLDWGAEATGTSAVLLYAPANSKSANFAVLIPNGAPGSPPALVGHNAVYDAADNIMIVFGGSTCQPSWFTCTTFAFYNEVWVLTNANGQGGTPVWTQLSPSGTPPAQRAYATAVYDSANNRLIVFGGQNAKTAFSDVWVLSNANGMGGTPTWTQLSPSGTGPTGEVAGVYDQPNNILITFGGPNAALTKLTNAVWTLSHANGLGGAPQWTNIVPDGKPGSPPVRFAETAVYDQANNRMIIFGGSNNTSKYGGYVGLNDVWVLTNANGSGGTPTWTQLKPKGTPPAKRAGHTAVYDQTTNQMMIFAGVDFEAVYYLVWVLNDANGL